MVVGVAAVCRGAVEGACLVGRDAEIRAHRWGMLSLEGGAETRRACFHRWGVCAHRELSSD